MHVLKSPLVPGSRTHVCSVIQEGYGGGQMTDEQRQQQVRAMLEIDLKPCQT